MNKQIESVDTNNFIRILKGSIFSLILTIILLLGVSLLLTYTNTSEEIMVPSIIAISSISILLGSLISSIKIRKNGIINGGIVGLIYILTIYLLSSLVQKDFGLNITSTIMISSSIFAGCVGGVVGVNIRKRN